MKKRIVKKYFRGNIYVYLLLLVVLAMAVALVAAPKFPSVRQTEAVNSCLDYDPPSKSDTVKYNGVQYDLIKKEGGVIDSKMGEMLKVGNYNGADIYQLTSTNYYGQAKDDDIIYVLRSQKNGYHYFDLYLKDGVPIPDFIKKSKSYGSGGNVQIIIDDSDQFPPHGFNTSDIVGLTISISRPAFLYGENKVTFSYIDGLSGVKQVGSLNTKKGIMPLYYHLDTLYLVDGQSAYEYIPTDTPVNFTNTQKGSKDSVQMKKFTIKTVNVNAICWYTPECKPAIYLYPERRMSVNVKVNPKGYFTYTNPSYQINGWQVFANPDGTLETDNKIYPYLYYESNLLTQYIEAPNKGFVVEYDKISELYDRLLPSLGLNNKEIKDFKDYWKKVLPKSPYYFIGVMSHTNIETLEPITISPKPTQIIRVRLYFEALSGPKKVEEPIIIPVDRVKTGFRVVEWGGVVKSDNNNSFTCSQ